MIRKRIVQMVLSMVSGLIVFPLFAAGPPSSELAPRPPMGWNSWDAYGTTVNEQQIRGNAKWMADHLKQFGWQYVTVDMEWFVTNPVAEGNSHNFHYMLDGYGRFTPDTGRFPSAKGDAGFKPLSDYVHSLGLKFGIHILQGVPREAIAKNTPIEGAASLHAADAGNPSAPCKWNYDYYDARHNAAGQAYYDSVARLYASWGVDLIKVDCIAANPYKGEEIRMLRQALQKTGRPIALSLSPGPAPVEKVEEMRKYAQQWRISNDTWDLWHSDQAYPQGVFDQFARAEVWAPLSMQGHWPDADMLPIGYLGPAPGWGKARMTRLTHDEQETLLTLWVMMRSPLMMGGELLHMDPWTNSILTNRDLIEVDQHSSGNHAALHGANSIVWEARGSTANQHYIAIFNTGDREQSMHYTWKSLGLVATPGHMRDLWKSADMQPARELTVSIPAHGCMLYRVTAR